jgi:GT2 family glycosyltransferase
MSPIALPKVCAAVVSYHHAAYLESCLSALLRSVGIALDIFVLENGEAAATQEVLKSFEGRCTLIIAEENLGFAAGGNLLAQHFVDSDAEYFVLVNPDLVVASDCFEKMLAGFERHAKAGLLTPKLRRVGSESALLDAAGMRLTSELRHFDRGSGEIDSGQFDSEEEVFGGTGACLMLRRSCLIDLALGTDTEERAGIEGVYPKIKEAPEARFPLFDEAFFAYREDAELALRAQRFGWQCWYIPDAQAFHERRVRTEGRKSLPAFINLLGVQNRFLLQWTHFSCWENWRIFFNAYFLRNTIVLLGVLLMERSSWPGVQRACALRRRARRRRFLINSRARCAMERIYYWMDKHY